MLTTFGLRYVLIRLFHVVCAWRHASSSTVHTSTSHSENDYAKPGLTTDGSSSPGLIDTVNQSDFTSVTSYITHTELTDSINSKRPFTRNHSVMVNPVEFMDDRIFRTHPYLKLSPKARQYTASTDNCFESIATMVHDGSKLDIIHDTEGVLLGMKRYINTPNAICRWPIAVPEGRYLVILADVFGHAGACTSTSFEIHVPAYKRMSKSLKMRCGLGFSKFPVFFLRNNVVTIALRTRYDNAFQGGLPMQWPAFRVIFTSTTEKLWRKMFPVFSSNMSGYITSPGFDITRSYGPGLDAWCNLTVPGNHAVMVSFPHFGVVHPERLGSVVSLSVVNADGFVSDQVTYNFTGYIFPKVFYPAVLVVHFASHEHLKYYNINNKSSGMNMSFSYHPLFAAPRELDNGHFNCSVSHYVSFRQHLHCNLQRECEGGEDEGAHCPFSSPACPGWVDAGGKCFFFLQSNTHLSWHTARAQCQKNGGELAMMKTSREWEAFWKLFHYGRDLRCAYIGLHLNSVNLHHMYKNIWTWVNNIVSFHVNVASSWLRLAKKVSTTDLYVMSEENVLRSLQPLESPCSRSVCQTEYTPTTPNVRHTRISINASSVRSRELIRCPAGHLTYNFLRCYSKSRCGVATFQSRCGLAHVEETPLSLSAESSLVTSDASTAMFVCENKRLTLPYTLVCDFKHDCSDHSDESFCKHGCPRNVFQCKNGQCFPLSHLCDRTRDCFDGSDEDGCNEYSLQSLYSSSLIHKLPAPTVVQFAKTGIYMQTSLTDSEPCPELYFRCPSSKDCLPVYVRCNGVNDCPQREDEEDCENYTCPGFYQCIYSRVCVHVTQLCDGFAQCLWQDDELFCNTSCPHSCHCQGKEFVCRSPFLAEDYDHLRYLDAAHTRMTMRDLHFNTYLVYVVLASCHLHSLDVVTLPNLQHLDLSLNSLTTLNMDVFLSLKQLKNLHLMGNPLAVLTGGHSDEHQYRLNRVDLSHTKLSHFSSSPLKQFLGMTFINISFCNLTVIGEEGFRANPTLQVIDMSGNFISKHPPNLFRTLIYIRQIYADNYKLCCPAMLPDGYEEGLCFALQNELSSCEDLLRSELYRLFLWLMCLATLLGNLGCLVFRNFILTTKSASGFHVFVSSLSLADCLMGVFLACIGVSDQVYRGSYYLHEDTWKASVWCSVSGVLSLLSSEVSAITICVITIDRFIALRFPFSTLRFTKQSAILACVLTWFLGAALSLAPLLVPHWEFYRQTGICIPLPVTRREFGGDVYAFAVMIIFNFTLFLTISAGQAFIYHSIRINTMAADTSQKLQDVTIARRLITVAVSDFLCWFPVGLLGLVASGGVPISGEVNVAMAIFVLPLNSALNPFLYTFNLLLERRRKKKEKELLEHLGTVNEGPVVSTAVSDPETAQRGVDKDDAIRCVRHALDTRLVSSDQLRAFLVAVEDL